MKNKKNVLFIILVVVLVLVLALILASKKEQQEEESLIDNQTSSEKEQSTDNEPNVPEMEVPVSQENFLTIDGLDFTSKTLYGEAGKRVFITFEAKDGAYHLIGSEDPALKDVFLVLIKEGEEKKSVAFPAPDAGEYSFYVDETDNVGSLIIN